MIRNRFVSLAAVTVLLTGACATGGGAERRAATGSSTSAPSSTSPSTSPSTTSTSTSTSTSPPTTTATSTTKPIPSTTHPPPANGGLAWSRCGTLQCATLAVPRDYDNPSGPTIGLALIRRPARSPATRIGSLVFAPGGPGNSGVSALPRELRVLTSALQARFDIVSFDPRGVGRSVPVGCRPAGVSPTAGNNSGPPFDPAPTTDAGRQALVEGYRAYAAACAEHTGDFLGKVGTDSTAEDLERIRAALGDEQLTFIGHSAGTFLGAVYADRYPQRVRALVLDGAVDPSLTLDQRALAQADGHERFLDGFFQWCTATPSCAWRPAGDRRAALLALMDRIRQQPLSGPGDQVVGIDDLINGMLGRLTSRGRWPSLGDALAAAERGDGTPLAKLATNYVNGGASNAADARMAITCLDHPSPRDTDAYPALAEATRARFPVFGPVFLWAVLACGVWSHPPTLEARPTRAPGSAPILVIGTTGDPATPQAWAEALAGQLEHGVLVLRNGAEHVAYYYSSCIRTIVDAYLVDGQSPAGGTTCAR